MSPAPTVRVANGFVQLVTHILAHVRLDQAGNLHDPRYVAWASARHSAECRALLEQDTELLAQLWAIDPRVDRVHAFCALHSSLASFRATAARELEQLSPTEVARPSLLVELRGFAAAELLHATAALLDGEVEAMLADVGAEIRRGRARVEDAAAQLCAHLPSLADERIELVWALGVHGRCLDDRVLVGLPTSWNRCSANRQAVLAAHEHFVRRSRETEYIEAEWSALCRLAELLAALPEDDLHRRTHASWLAELELGPLVRGAATRGWIDEGTRRRLSDEPQRRAETFAALGKG